MGILSGLTALFTSVGTWFSGLGAIAQFAVRVGVGLALNGIASAIARARQDDFKTPGVTFQLQQGADTPRAFMLGRGATAGSLVYHNSWGSDGGTPNAYYTRLTAVSDLPVTGLVEVWLDGKIVTLDYANEDPDKGFPVLEYQTSTSREIIIVEPERGTPGASETVVDVENYCWVKFHDGNQVAADSFVVSQVATVERPWTAAEVGVGVAYVVLTTRFNREMFQGTPRALYVLDGVPLFDPSTGLTGTGDTLSALQAYHVLKGFYFQGEWLYGLQGIPSARFDDDWTDRINDCRIAVPGTYGMSDPEKIAAFGSTTIPAQYRSGGEIQVDIEIGNALEAILTGCNGRLVDTGWKYRLLVGPSTVANATISDGDILSTQQQTFTPFYGLADLTNGITASHPEPSQEWQPLPAPPLYVPEYEAEDGGRRLLNKVPMDMVPYREQVQRLMAAALAEARRARRHTMTLGPKYWGLEPGDVISWSSVRNGYAPKLFRVDGLYDLPTADVVFDLTEIDPSDYDWIAATDYRPATPGSIVPQYVPFQPFSGWAVAPYILTDANGVNRRAGFLLSWDRLIDGVVGVRFQIRVKNTLLGILDAQTPSFDAGGVVVSEGLSPNVEYEVRGIYLVNDGRPVLWSGWLTVTTPDVRVSEIDLADTVITAIETAQSDATDSGIAAAGALAAANTVQDNLNIAVANSDAVDGILASHSSELEARLNLLGPMNVDPQGLLGLLGYRDGHTEPTSHATVNLTTATTADPTRSGLDIIASGYGTAFHEERIPIDLTHTYRVTVRVKRSTLISPIANAKISIGLTNRDATGEVNGDGGPNHSFCAAYNVSTGLPLDADYHEFVGVISGVGAGASQFRSTTAFVSRVFNLNLGSSDVGDVMNLSQFDIEDITAGETISARTSLTEVALAETDGTVQAMTGMTAVTEDVNGVTRVAEIRLTSAADPDGSGATAITMNADNVIADGTLSTNALVVGLGRQMLRNSDWSNGLQGWTGSKGPAGNHADEITSELRPAGYTYAGERYETYMIQQLGASVDSAGADLYYNAEIVEGNIVYGEPISEGQWVEASVNVSALNCSCWLYLRWIDADTLTIGWTTVASVGPTDLSPNNPEEWFRLWGKAQAPAGAAYVGWLLRKKPTSSGGASWLFAHHPQLATSNEFSNVPIPWGFGGTTLLTDKGIRTGVINSDHINTESFAVAGLAVFGGYVQSIGATYNPSTGVATGWKLDNDPAGQSWISGDLILDGVVSKRDYTTRWSTLNIGTSLVQIGRSMNIDIADYIIADPTNYPFEPSNPLTAIISGSFSPVDALAGNLTIKVQGWDATNSEWDSLSFPMGRTLIYQAGSDGETGQFTVQLIDTTLGASADNYKIFRVVGSLGGGTYPSTNCNIGNISIKLEQLNK